MTNRTLIGTLKKFVALMELHQFNDFKIRAYQNTIYQLQKTTLEVAQASNKELQYVGFTESMTEKICLLCTTNTFPELQELLDKTPEGILQILNIKGIGAKKVRLLWKELGIENLDELKQAGLDNQIEKLKGFGKKTQATILHEIEFLEACQGWVRYADAESEAHFLCDYIQQCDHVKLAEITGAFRRNLEIISQLQIIVGTEDFELLETHLNRYEKIRHDAKKSGIFVWRGTFTELDLKIEIKGVHPSLFYNSVLIHSAGEAHLTHQTAINKSLLQVCQDQIFESEESIYQSINLPYILPELREGLFEFDQAENQQLPDLIKSSDLKGIIHNHSTYSDGANTLREMALACRDLGYEYLGISDHSKTAVYANGLTEDRIKTQHQEIDELNHELAPFKIFKGIESDILTDGSLDYADDVLDSFDFVITSVHQTLNMTKVQATTRILNAISNPYTTILGHPTGRLLLRRKGYELDYEAIFEACVKHQVVIEINANPLRLDLDWRQIHRAIEMGVLLSINPDAHHKEQYKFMRYGVLVARKGGLEKKNTLNSMDLKTISEYFHQRKKAVQKS